MLLLCGKTASGKDATREKLIEMGYKPLITYTTRNPREGEVDGITYHFISKREFLRLITLGFFIETTKYKLADGTVVYYGTSKESLKEADEKTVQIINPEGLVQIQKYAKKKNLKCFSVYLSCPKEILFKRLCKRGDDLAEANRRLLADEKDFIDISNKVNTIIENTGIVKIDKIASIINVQYLDYLKETI